MKSIFSEIEHLNLTKFKEICILTHRSGDMDAFCASYSIGCFFIKKSYSSITYVFPGGLSSNAEALRQYLKVDYNQQLPNRCDLVVVVDAGSPYLLDEYYDLLKNVTVPKLLIDHHPLQEDSKGFYNYFVVDEQATSSSEIIFHLFRKYDVAIPDIISNVLLLGILFDTRHLSVATEDTLKNVCFLIDLGASLSWCESVLTIKKNRSEAIAKLKSLSRVRLYEAEDLIISIVKIGSFQASVAKFLVDGGSDIALAYGEDKDGLIKGSLRCSYEASKVGSLKLNTLAELLVKGFNGVGGGHRFAASFNVECGESQLISSFLALSEKMLSRKIRKLSLK
ncbi:MAG: DHH family phosphoesterase [Nitrososphaeria archaeon]